MDEGKIIQQGDFETVKSSELYQHFLELNRQQNIEEEEPSEKQQNESKILDIIPKELPQKNSDHKQRAFGDRLEHNGNVKNVKGEVTYKKSKRSFRSIALGRISERFSTEIIVREEERNYGKVTFKVLKTFMDYLGGPVLITSSLILSILSQLMNMLFDKSMEDFSDVFEGSKVNYFTAGLIGINCAMIFLFVISAAINVGLNKKVSLHLHSNMVFSLIHAKLQGFLESVSYGQIQNRFSKDIIEVDETSNTLFFLFATSLANFIVCCFTLAFVINWVILLIIAFCFIIVYRLQDSYMMSKTEYIVS